MTPSRPSISGILCCSLVGVVFCASAAAGWAFWGLAKAQSAAQDAELGWYATTVAHQLDAAGGVVAWGTTVSQVLRGLEVRASESPQFVLQIAIPVAASTAWQTVLTSPQVAAEPVPKAQIEIAQAQPQGGSTTWSDKNGSPHRSYMVPVRDAQGHLIAVVEARSRLSAIGLREFGVSLGLLAVALGGAGIGWVVIHRRIRLALAMAEAEVVGGTRTDVARTVQQSTGPDFQSSGEVEKSASSAEAVAVAAFAQTTAGEQTVRSLRLKREIIDLQVQVSRFQGADRIKSTLLVALCRSLRTAVDSLRGRSTQLMQTRLDRSQRDAVDSLQTGCGDLLSRINDVLDFALLDAECLRLDQRPFRPRQVLEEAMLIVSERCALQQIELAWHADSVVPERVIGDVPRIRQVLVNLIHVAVSTAEEGTVVVHVTVDADDSLAFRISLMDVTLTAERIRLMLNGAISNDSSSDRLRGEGLSLMLGKRLAQAMGGSLVVERGEGEDIELVCTLRVAADDVAPERPLLNRHIVVAHERPATRRMLVSLLERAGATVAVVETPAEVRELPSTSGAVPAAVIVSTRMLEDGKSTDLTSGINMISALAQRLPVALVVDHQHRDQCVSFRSAGLTGLLAVPVRLQQLLRVVGDLCSGIKHESGAEMALSPGSPLPLRVLVVEDNEVNQLVLVRMLESFGIQPELAINGREAVERMRAAAAQPYALVLMDIMMPVMDGLEATREIRKQEQRHPPVWIIAVTANSLANDCEKCLDAGMNDYLPKPVTPLALGGAISRWRQATGQGPANQSANQSMNQQGKSQRMVSDTTGTDAATASLTSVLDARSARPESRAFSAIEVKTPTTSEVDFSGLKTLVRLAGQAAVVEVIDCFLHEVAALRGGIQDAVQDAQLLRAAAHKFKGSSGTVGLRGLSAHIAAIEAAAKAEDMVRAAQLIALLPAICAQGEAELRAFREGQSPQ